MKQLNMGLFNKLDNLKDYFIGDWKDIMTNFIKSAKNYNDGIFEAINFSYNFNPILYTIMSTNVHIFDLKKAGAMYNWYKKADASDHSILDFFSEYNNCTDEAHPFYNSNYGLYAYSEYGLSNCIRVLEANRDSRQSCFCINNNDAMSNKSIDKLCTNTIQFFIRDNKLEMIIQMRSSNFLTLLPYDAFMFSVFFFEVYEKLQNKYNDLETGLINIHVSSIHIIEDQLDEKVKDCLIKNEIPKLFNKSIITSLIT